MKRLFPLLLALMLLAGCATPSSSRQFFAMDTSMTITLSGRDADAAATAVIQEVNRLEALLSRTRPESDVSRLNAGAGAPVPLSPETRALLQTARDLALALPGGFDPTIAPLVDAWGFAGEDPQVPAADALTALLPLVGAEGLVLTEEGARLTTPGMAADLGGIAKGYAADRAAALLADRGITSALLSLGASSVAAVGSRPDGAPWRIGVRDPQNVETHLGVLSLTGAMLSTSGGYERFFQAGGQIYHHILDPRTGYPAQSDLLSVTVVCQSGTQADALSTALYVLGSQAALDYWRGREDLGLVLVRDDNTVLVTENLHFQGEGDGYTYETVRR